MRTWRLLLRTFHQEEGDFNPHVFLPPMMDRHGQRDPEQGPAMQVSHNGRPRCGVAKIVGVVEANVGCAPSRAWERNQHGRQRRELFSRLRVMDARRWRRQARHFSTWSWTRSLAKGGIYCRGRPPQKVQDSHEGRGFMGGARISSMQRILGVV